MQYKKHLAIFFFISIAFLFLSGCGTNHSVKTKAPLDYAEKMKTEKLNAAIIESAAHQVGTGDDYHIGPEDLLEIDAYNVDEVKKTVRVNSQGDIALPLVGIIQVKGLTTFELEQLIAKKLEKYVQETVVNVFVKEYHSQKISVVGAVKNPQVYAVTGQRYLIDMLMAAGGLRETAGNICYIIRPANKSAPESKASTIVINLDELLVKGNFALNLPVFAGDLISVPEGGIFFVDGAVKNPGVFTMKGKTTVIQALTMAKGVNPEAKMSDIRIFRTNSKGERDIIPVDYDAIRKGESPDIFIVENDIIIVPQSGIKNFFNGFINSLRGVFSIGGGSFGAGL
jgi:polysaccharide biosynthesis/export protein